MALNVAIYKIKTTIDVEFPNGRKINSYFTHSYVFQSFLYTVSEKSKYIGIEYRNKIYYFTMLDDSIYNVNAVWGWLRVSYKEMKDLLKKEHEQQLILGLAGVK